MDTWILFNGLLLATFAGLSTSIGAFIVFFQKKPNPNILSLTLGLSAGVMITVSFYELLPASIDGVGFFESMIVFFAAILIMFALDILIPHNYEAEGCLQGCEKCTDETHPRNPDLMRTGKLIAFGIFIHNVPEGIITIAGILESTRLGILLAVAIAMHNIPEGISVAIPLNCASENPRYAFKITFLSGLAEPLGAILAIIFLIPFLDSSFLPLSLAFVAGFMIFVSVDELLPAASAYNKPHTAATGFFLGMAIMLFTIILMP